jgi:hypothetical protein
MEVLTPKATRRSTRLRVEIPITVTSLDRLRPFAEKCVALVVSCQGCGFRSSRALQIETPIFLSDLPGGGSVTGRVASCLPLGSDGQSYLVGAALYTQGNVWGVANPPADWISADPTSVAKGAAAAGVTGSVEASGSKPGGKISWPYNLISDKTATHRRKK